MTWNIAKGIVAGVTAVLLLMGVVALGIAAIEMRSNSDLYTIDLLFPDGRVFTTTTHKPYTVGPCVVLPGKGDSKLYICESVSLRIDRAKEEENK